MYNTILQINNVNKTSKRLKNYVDIKNQRIIQTERPLTTRILLRLDFGLSRESQTVLDDERSNKIGNEGGASGLVFFGMQVEFSFGAITR
jgi:hypothetical protein